MTQTPTKQSHSTDPRIPRTTRDVVLVGSGERARAWLVPLRRSGRLRVVATVARGSEAVAPDLPRFGSLGEALRTYPEAAFALALPPRAGLEGALWLAEGSRQGIVEAPLHDALADVDLGPGAAGVRVAHGWVTLPGIQAARALMRRAGTGRLRITVAGLPEENGCDPAEGLVHGLALVRALLPQAVATGARRRGGGLDVALTASAPAPVWNVDLSLREHGRRLEVRIEGLSEMAIWSWAEDRESVMLGETPLVAPRITPVAPVRALAQLLPDAPRGDGLDEAAAVLRLARDCLALLPTRLPLGGRALRQSASIARRRPADLLDQLGLRGELPAGAGPPASVLNLLLPPEPFELWAFRAGIKPVAFLTVRPDDVERTLAFFGDVHHERRERLVRVGAQDRWTDRRDEGEPRVELYIARDAEMGRRAAYLQAEGNPTAALREIGGLVGYPPCCVEAFAQQDDRANNSRNRYHSQARTLGPDGSTQTPWPWELNNLHTMIVPFYPCSYRCQAALNWARACLEELARVHPEIADGLRTILSRPVLYFDHDHQLIIDGEYADGRIAYSCVRQLESASLQLTALAAAINRGSQLSLDDRELVVERSGEIVLRLVRTDPALGFLAPFGAS
jgi:hypothetical protein